MTWPVLTARRADELLDSLPLGGDLERLANKVAIYPGGGAPAHRLRRAAADIEAARAFLIEHAERPS